MKDNRDKTKLKPTYVPSYDYFAVDGDRFVGVIHIRIELTPRVYNIVAILDMGLILNIGNKDMAQNY